ncbi:MAG: stage III sporulation protein AB [Tissierellia bacterium]|nr:stage III sporulation protein AB [Tissierellia bacterium]
MGFVKFLGSLLIFSSTTWIGFYYGRKYSNRLRNLIHIEQCIKILETEIVYGATPLPEALTNIYNKGNKKVSFIFQDIRDHLMNSGRGDVFHSFSSVIEPLRDKLNFTEEDIEIFLSLGRVLGSSDRHDQEKNLKLILNQIKFLQDDAKIERDKHEKMFKNLGILTGLAIIIILI